MKLPPIAGGRRALRDAPPPPPPTRKPPPASRLKSRRASGSFVPPPSSPTTAPPPTAAQAPLTRSADHAPRVPAPSRPVSLRILDKYISSIAASLASIVLVFCPALHFMWFGSFDKTILLWSEEGLLCSLATSISWFVYGVFSWKEGKTLEAIMPIITSSWSASCTLSFLLIRSGFTRQKKRAICVFILTMAFVAMALALIQIHLSDIVLQILAQNFSQLGLVLLAYSHFIQIKDLLYAKGPVELIVASIALFPGWYFSMVQTSVTFLSPNPDHYMVITCYINAVAYPIEFILMSKIFHDMKKNKSVKKVKKSLRRNLAFKRHTEVDIESQRPAGEDQISSPSSSSTVILGEEEPYYSDWILQQQSITGNQMEDIGMSMQLLFQDGMGREEEGSHGISVPGDPEEVDIYVGAENNLELLFNEPTIDDPEEEIFTNDEYYLELLFDQPATDDREEIFADDEYNQELLFEDAAIDGPILAEGDISEREIEAYVLVATGECKKRHRRATLVELVGLDSPPKKRVPKERHDRSRSFRSWARTLKRWLSFGCHEHV